MTAWPQILVLALCVTKFGFHVGKAGEPMRMTYNPIGYAIHASIWFFILYRGGFFRPLGWAP